MKIAFFVGEFPLLSETFVLNQIIGLLNRGHTVDIYPLWKPKDNKSHEEVEKYKLSDKSFYPPLIPKNKLLRVVKSLWIMIRYAHLGPFKLVKTLNIFRYGSQAASFQLLYASIPLLKMRNTDYDIIHCHFGPRGLRGLYLRQIGIINGDLSVVFHGQDISQLLPARDDAVYRPLFNSDATLLPISQRWKKRLLELGAFEDRIIVHHMGIDCNRIKFSPRQLSSNGRVRIVSIARLTEKKGIIYGIRAIAKLLKLGKNVEYQVAGDGPLRTELEQEIKNLDLNHNVKLLGWLTQDEIIDLLSSSHLFLAPSITSSTGDQEGIPVALMEAMAKGLVVVSTLHSGIPELVENGKSGFLVPEKSVVEMADRLSYLVDNPLLWPQIGKAGRERVLQEFHIDTLNDELVKIFENITS